MTVREELIAKLDDLSDEQVAHLLSSAESMVARSRRIYDPAKDPMRRGLFSGPPDLGERSKEILRAEYGLKTPHLDEQS